MQDHRVPSRGRVGRGFNVRVGRLQSGRPTRRLAAFSLVWIILVQASPWAAADDLADGWTLYNTGKYTECAGAAEKGIKATPWLEEWRHMKIRAEMATGQYAEARTTLDTALRQIRSSIRLRLVGHKVYQLNDQPVEALRMFTEIESLIGRQPRRYEDPANLIALGQFFLLRGMDARQVLEAVYDTVRKVRPSFVPTYLASGELALEKHDYAVAAENFEKALMFSRNDPAIHFGLAQAYAPGEPEKAAASLSRALELNPNHVDSLLTQVDHQIDAEEYGEAKELLARVFKVNAVHPAACAYRAILAHLESDAAAETQWRDAALAPWSTNPEVDHLIGRKLSQKYRFAEGAAHQRLALGFDGSYLPAKIQLSQDLLRLGEEAEGWQLADEVYKGDGYNVAAHNLVTLHESMAKYKTLEADGFVLRMEPREADIYGESALELLKRAKRVLCAKYEVTLEGPIVVEIFAEQKDFAVRTFGMPGGAGFLGVCFGTVITANSPASQGEHPSNWQAVLWHEFCHVVTLNKTNNKMPRWLSEGISVYEEMQENVSWGQSISAQYRKMVLDGELVPVSQLSGAFLHPESPLHLQFAYYESSLVVEYLVERHGMTTLKLILDDLAVGKAINTVLEDHVGSLTELDEGFEKFAQRRAGELAAGADWDTPELSPGADLASIAAWNEQHPDNVLGLQLWAEWLIREEKWSEAKRPLETLLKLYPENVGPDNAYALLARVHRELGETEAERSVLDSLAALDADVVAVYLRLMELYEDTEDWEALALNAERMLAVNPLVRTPHRYLARAAEGLDEPARAISPYRALLRMDPLDPAEAHYRLARALDKTGDSASARREVLMALEEAPRYRAAHRTLLEIIRRTESSPSETDEIEAEPPESESSEPPSSEKD